MNSSQQQAGPSSHVVATLPASAETWSLKVNGVEHNYGQVHEMIHRDISIGNDYRKERIKHAITVAGGAFALTVTFQKDLFAGHITREGLTLMLIGWLLLLASLLAGILHLKRWEDFYLQHRSTTNAIWRYRTAGNGPEKSNAAVEFEKSRKKIEKLREGYRTWNFIQIAGLLLGLACIASNVALSAQSEIKAQKSVASSPAPSTPAVPPSGQRIQ